MTHVCCYCGSSAHDTKDCKWGRVQQSLFSRHVGATCSVSGEI